MSESNITLNELLDDLGFVQFDYIVYQFVIPFVGTCGSLLSLLTTWIFFKAEFRNEMYDYYRVLSIVHFIHLSLSVPYGLFFTPRYFSNIDTYSWATYQSFYITFSNFLCHYAGVLEVGIIMDRLRVFSPFVKKYYILLPKVMCFLFFIACCFINLFEVFVYIPGPGGVYYYKDQHSGFKQNTFYYVVVTPFSVSVTGQIMTKIVYIVRDLFTLIASIALNIISMIYLEQYLKKKKNFVRQPHSHINLSPTNAYSQQEISSIYDSAKEEKRRKTELKLIEMVIVLVFLAILERLILFACNIYYLFALNYITLILGTITDLVLLLHPFFSFFLFLFFNSIFKKAVIKFLIKFLQ